MAKVTSKLQVTLPKALAERYRIKPGDEIDWEPAGEVIRVLPPRRKPKGDIPTRLKLFDQASARQQARERTTAIAVAEDRGWSREELYERGGYR